MYHIVQVNAVGLRNGPDFFSSPSRMGNATPLHGQSVPPLRISGWFAFCKYNTLRISGGPCCPMHALPGFRPGSDVCSAQWQFPSSIVVCATPLSIAALPQPVNGRDEWAGIAGLGMI